MNLANDPIFYAALGFAGMLLCAWLFDRAQARYISDTLDDQEDPPPTVWQAIRNLIGALLIAAALWFAFYKTALVVADVLLVAALSSFAVSSYRIRLKPLVAAGMALPHLALLIAALTLWALPLLWFFHLHLLGAYSAG